MSVHVILDTSVVIDMNIGTRTQKRNCILKLDPLSPLYITKMILGEINRTILKTAVKLITSLIEKVSELSQYPTIEEFIDSISIEIPTYSLHEKDRIMKLMLLLKQRIRFYFDVYRSHDILFSIGLDSILDDLIHFKAHFLKDVNILSNSYECYDSKNEFIYDPIEKKVSMTHDFKCKPCEFDTLRHFYDKYTKELQLINDFILSNPQKINPELKKVFPELFNIKNVTEIDGRSHLCYQFVDLFLILETPNNFQIFTTNIPHFSEISKILNKKLLN